MLTAEQLAKRRQGIGASEVAAVVGLSSFSTALDVFRSKVEDVRPEDTPEKRRGHFLEPGVREWYAAETGSLVLAPVDTLAHPERPHFLATPDGYALHGSERRVLEVKTAAWAEKGEWGEDGTDQVPAAYLVQCQWQMLVTGLKRADLAALLWGSEFRVYPIERDDALIAMLAQQVDAFWRNHVLAKTPPPLQGDEATARYLAAKYPEHRAELRPPTPEAVARHAAYWAAKVEHEAVTARLEKEKNELKALIGDAAGIEGLATWKRTKDTEKTDWEALARDLASDAAQGNEKEAARILEVSAKQFTTRKAGHRVFKALGGSNGDE